MRSRVARFRLRFQGLDPDEFDRELRDLDAAKAKREEERRHMEKRELALKRLEAEYESMSLSARRRSQEGRP